MQSEEDEESNKVSNIQVSDLTYDLRGHNYYIFNIF